MTDIASNDAMFQHSLGNICSKSYNYCGISRINVDVSIYNYAP